jgi:hypothetical protein
MGEGLKKMTKLQVTITVNENKLSPARVTEEMVKGFVFLREGYFGVSEADLRLEIETLTVKSPKRERHSRRVEAPDLEVVNQEYIDANPEPDEPEEVAE